MKQIFLVVPILTLLVSGLAFIHPKTNTPAVLSPDPDNGGLKLAHGFGALTVANELGQARHLAVDSSGIIFVKLGRLREGKGIVELQDTNGDGKIDKSTLFGNFAGTGIAIYNSFLYVSSDTSVYRYKLINGQVVENTKPETIVTGLTFQRQHASKPLAFSPNGKMYITFGAPSNACQEKDRQKGSKGMDPCPLLEHYGGIWEFDANRLNQKQSDGIQYATGIRNAVAIDWNTATNTLYALQHGRDNLNDWGGLFTNEVSAELPSEEFLLVKKGSDFGWPYCYNDHMQNKKVLAPEYGGDGKKVDRCVGKDKPIMAFPGHWAPNDVLFYTGNQFPARYKNGAFICFHGSWNRAPLNQAGYFVAFVPFGKDGKPSNTHEVFAEGFAGDMEVKSPDNAKHRPVGLAQGPDGSLYITDSVKGKVWRVLYTGKN